MGRRCIICDGTTIDDAPPHGIACGTDICGVYGIACGADICGVYGIACGTDICGVYGIACGADICGVYGTARGGTGICEVYDSVQTCIMSPMLVSIRWHVPQQLQGRLVL